MDLDELIALKLRVAPELRAIPGVTGVGVGFKVTGGVLTDQVVIRVYVAEKRDDIPEQERIPTEIEGVPTDVLRGWWEPTVGLVSGGYGIATAQPQTGTMGLVCTGVVGLTNWHVVQGVGVGGQVTDRADNRIGQVIAGGITSTADWATFSIESPWVGAVGRIPGIGVTHGSRAAVLNETVKKYGATSAVTTGTVVDIHLDLTRTDGHHFTGQIGISQLHMGDPDFVGPGDSGSVVVGADGMVVGLAHAASPGHGGVASPISEVPVTIPNTTGPVIIGTGLSTDCGNDVCVDPTHIGLDAGHLTGSNPAAITDHSNSTYVEGVDNNAVFEIDFTTLPTTHEDTTHVEHVALKMTVSPWCRVDVQITALDPDTHLEIFRFGHATNATASIAEIQVLVPFGGPAAALNDPATSIQVTLKNTHHPVITSSHGIPVDTVDGQVGDVIGGSVIQAIDLTDYVDLTDNTTQYLEAESLVGVVGAHFDISDDWPGTAFDGPVRIIDFNIFAEVSGPVGALNRLATFVVQNGLHVTPATPIIKSFALPAIVRLDSGPESNVDTSAGWSPAALRAALKADIFASITRSATFVPGGPSSTWTAPPGVTSVIVECWGGGEPGAGGRGGGEPGASGRGGGYARSTVSVVPGTTYEVAVDDGDGITVFDEPNTFNPAAFMGRVGGGGQGDVVHHGGGIGIGPHSGGGGAGGPTHDGGAGNTSGTGGAGGAAGGAPGSAQGTPGGDGATFGGAPAGAPGGGGAGSGPNIAGAPGQMQIHWGV